jgi:hypothetical protein
MNGKWMIDYWKNMRIGGSTNKPLHDEIGFLNHHIVDLKDRIAHLEQENLMLRSQQNARDRE